LGALDQEWRLIREAQQARGAWEPPTGLRRIKDQFHNFLALSVPAVVLTTKRAWAVTEAAYARGFDSPKRRPSRKLRMKLLDWALLLAALGVGLIFLIWQSQTIII
jgi:energy-coupling factor transporter transmembrane protein EcfT